VGCTPFGDTGIVLRGAPRLDAIGVGPDRGVVATPDPVVMPVPAAGAGVVVAVPVPVPVVAEGAGVVAEGAGVVATMDVLSMNTV